jgi:hypothetical protein
MNSPSQATGQEGKLQLMGNSPPKDSALVIASEVPSLPVYWHANDCLNVLCPGHLQKVTAHLGSKLPDQAGLTFILDLVDHGLDLSSGLETEMRMGILNSASTIKMVERGIWPIVSQVKGEEI